MKISNILMIACMLCGLVFANVPKEYSAFVTLYEPSSDGVTTKDYVHFKGQVLDNGSVNINNKPVFINKAGRFSHFARIESLGEHALTAHFKSSNYDFTVSRTIVKLKNPKELAVSKRELAVLNTDLVTNRMKQSKLTDVVTRSDLVYFSYKLFEEHNATTAIRVIEDVPETSDIFQAVNQMVISGVFTLDQTNHFRPNESVNMLHFIAAYSRTKGIVNDPDKRMDIPVDSSVWYYPLVQIGRQNKLIDETDMHDLKEPLTIHRFIQIVSTLSEVSDRIDAVLGVFPENDSNHFVSTDAVVSFSEATDSVIEETPDPMALTNQDKPLAIYSDFVTIYSITKLKNTIRVNGRLAERAPFTVNWKFVSIDKHGEFEFDVPLNQVEALLVFFDRTIPIPLTPSAMQTTDPDDGGKIDESQPIQSDAPDGIIDGHHMTKKNTELLAAASNDALVHTINQQYSDISAHWIRDKLYGLADYATLFIGDTFEPTKPVTRSEFARLLAMVKTLPIIEDATVSFTDVSQEDAPFVHAIVEKGYVNGMSRTMFGSDSALTRLQAVVAVVRTLPDMDVSTVYLPFDDVDRYTWGLAYLKKALAYNLISSNTMFFPSKPIDRAQLVSIFYNLQQL